MTIIDFSFTSCCWMHLWGPNTSVLPSEQCGGDSQGEMNCIIVAFVRSRLGMNAAVDTCV